MALNRIGKIQPHNGIFCAQAINPFRKASAPVNAARNPSATRPAPAPTSAARGNIQRRCCLISRYSWISDRADESFFSVAVFVSLRGLFFRFFNEGIFTIYLFRFEGFQAILHFVIIGCPTEAIWYGCVLGSFTMHHQIWDVHHLCFRNISKEYYSEYLPNNYSLMYNNTETF